MNNESFRGFHQNILLFCRGACVLKALSSGLGCIPNFGSILQAAGNVGADYLSNQDHKQIQDRLAKIGEVGDIMEQRDIARQVASRITKRYTFQLKMLSHEEERESTGCCCILKSCCPCGNNNFSKNYAERIAEFGVTWIVAEVSNPSNKQLKEGELNSEADLVNLLVAIVSEAKGPKKSLLNCACDDPSQYLQIGEVINNGIQVTEIK